MLSMLGVSWIWSRMEQGSKKRKERQILRVSAVWLRTILRNSRQVPCLSVAKEAALNENGFFPPLFLSFFLFLSVSTVRKILPKRERLFWLINNKLFPISPPLPALLIVRWTYAYISPQSFLSSISTLQRESHIPGNNFFLLLFFVTYRKGEFELQTGRSLSAAAASGKRKKGLFPKGPWPLDAPPQSNSAKHWSVWHVDVVVRSTQERNSQDFDWRFPWLWTYSLIASAAVTHAPTFFKTLWQKAISPNWTIFITDTIVNQTMPGKSVEGGGSYADAVICRCNQC